MVDFKFGNIDSSTMERFSRLKLRNRALQVMLSFGGWAFNDPGSTRDTFTKMAATEHSRSAFINSVVAILEGYGLDGIDIDWEYPRAEDRGGRPEDYDNYPILLQGLRQEFDKYGRGWKLSIAIPASYWYLQHFDLRSMQKSVDWFNLMSYDMHGKWDQDNPYTGPYVQGHTNITEIEMSLDLLRRSKIDFTKVNLGIGFYGRTFTLSDPKCTKPGCTFSAAGEKGECSGEPGILTFSEIMARSTRLVDKRVESAGKDGFKYMVYDENQWITYDDAETYTQKRILLDDECLGGVMIWAIDQDTTDFKALSGLLGDTDYETNDLIEGGIVTEEENKAIASELGGLTGDSCYVTSGCADGKNNDGSEEGRCKEGDIAIERLHAPGGSPPSIYESDKLVSDVTSCRTGQWKTICCSAKSPAINCKWMGGPKRSETYCSGGLGRETCGVGRYELATDLYSSYTGGAPCDDYGNNDQDPHDPSETDIGDDPYGFVVLDGDEEAVQDEFHLDFIFVHDEDGTGRPIKKRETLTRDDPNIMSWTFEPEESFWATLTIRLLHFHAILGSGPFARIVSMDPVNELQLPEYHVRKRSSTNHTSPVYRVVFDYDFAAIRRTGSNVNIRIDYTNLVPYWDTMTGEKSPKGAEKRSVHDKRWWGTFTDWVKKMSTVRLSDAGKLPLSFQKQMVLYRKRATCARGNVQLKAGLDVILSTKFDMNARWAYYAQGTIVPLNIDSIYTYFGKFQMAPVVEAALDISGSAQMEYRMKERIKIIDTLSYPGLAIKEIAAIGPTMDLYGEMKARATLAGQLRAAARIEFPRYEVYFPQAPEAEEYQKFPTPDEDKEQVVKDTSITPMFDASVSASVGVDLIITPEVNLGIKVNAKGVKDDIVNAQIVGFVNNTFRFEVAGKASAGVGNTPAVTYDIFIKYIYNFGIGGVAKFKWLGEWALKPLQLFPGEGKVKMLYEHHGKISGASRRRSLSEGHGSHANTFVPLYNSTFHFDDEWFSAGRTFESSSFTKRDDKELSDTGVLGKKGGFFTCNDDGKCASGGCAGDACEWVPPAKPSSDAMSRRADGDPENEDPKDTDTVQPCLNSLPVFMYNCKYLPDRDGGEGTTFPGICHNILNYFADFEGGGSGPFQATYHHTRAEDRKNRRRVCGTGDKVTYKIINSEGKIEEKTTSWSQRCGETSEEYARRVNKGIGSKNGNMNWFSCDEFPFNSLEEGGNPSQVARACVPGYQQIMQGNANQVLDNIQQLVSWTDSKDKPQTAWKPWAHEGDSDWRSQRNTRYGQSRGGINKDIAWNWAYNNEKKFTIHLFDSDNDATPAGGTYSIFNHKLSKGNIGEVIAAVNLLDNPKYRMIDDKFNAWCTTGEYAEHLWGKFPRIQMCKVTFDNAAALAKLGRGDLPTSEEIIKIHHVELIDDEDFSKVIGRETGGLVKTGE
ncbi:hypothetical protein BDV96DRAFT_642728 [Lophiotrema nucula]|uniref:chitinase n=1 Tax=Lophiotrema nucula TaxID=690887 RepID=A0A6A5ZKN8_9PLEO|nr:hypothetical protein BDV96DRAFT_642728 [Lophiotrema nucula]